MNALVNASSKRLLEELEECVSLGLQGQKRCAAIRSVLSGKDDVSLEDIAQYVRSGAKPLLRSLQKYVSWDNHEKAKDVEAFLATLPEISADDITRMKQLGLDIRDALYDFEKFLEKTSDEKKVAEKYSELRNKYPFLSAKLKKIMEYQANRKKRLERNQNFRKTGKSLSSVISGRPHAIQTLDPCTAWDLVIDESGMEFEVGAKGAQAGKVVGLLIPWGSDLPALKDFHAISASPEEVDQAVQAILDRPVGVFGISVTDIPEAVGERWMDGVCEVVHWVWQLLPLDPQTLHTELRVHIENRGDYEASLDLKALERELLRQWARMDASRKVGLSMSISPKDGHDFLGYVDSVAFTWGSSAQESRERLKRSALLGDCLQTIGSGRKLRDLRDFYARPELLDGEYWKWLSGLPGSDRPESLSGHLLGRLATYCADNPTKWDEYVGALFESLDSKALDLQILGRQCAWLAQYRPAGKALPVAMELMWNVSLLANANHLGKTECQDMIRLIKSAGDSLLEEDARLVCKADLHLAVQATNRFEFDEASRFMDRWRGMPRLEEMFREMGLASAQLKQYAELSTMAIGLQLSGRVKSTLGQHLAFAGRLPEARSKLEMALKDFDRLSDPVSAARDMEQTGIYLAIASMDDPSCTPAEVTRLVESVVGTINLAIGALASSTKVQDKYKHHLLVRYLVQSDDEKLVKEYLRSAKTMSYDYGHPWPLIQFYRSLLARKHAPQLWQETAKSIWDLAFDPGQGATVRYIGMCLGVALGLMDASWPVFTSEVQQLRTALPGAQARLDLLERYAAVPTESPLETVQALLPFNFR